MREKAILVGVNINDTQDAFAYSMQELAELAAACQIETVGKMTQNLHRVNPAYYIGTGKLEGLIELIKEKEADLVIFDDELSSMQIRNLEAKLDCDVIDRTMVILNIFSNRAKTRESQLQVEVARLKYMLPRLVGSRQSLGRQGGGAGLKNRGAGETKLELDRRKIEERIAKLSEELESLANQRHTQRKKRRKNEQRIVSLVGYTNAGKSTIMNAVLDETNGAVDKQVFEKDMVFATLETAVRHVKLDSNKEFLLTDTVGFINKLPHHLIKAFRSTLEEVLEANLIVHVIDSSNPNHEQQRTLTNDILAEIGVKDTPIIYVYNKADVVDKPYPAIEGDAIYLSAKEKIGIEALVHIISKHIFQDQVLCKFLIPYTDGQIVSYLNEHAHVLSEEYEEAGVQLKVECSQMDVDRYKKYIVEVSEAEGNV